ncbi:MULTISPECIES: VanW family protein [Bacillus cereus group]|uniref:VanW family protein n=1 Tax=Bacillus cereus group TaxID=86661 RepID=UPI000D9A14CB|nr:VanW family protein [Bacillus cereus]SPT76326.1 putative vancomycin b-type resistance protein [Bacillus cereus]
MPDKTYNLIIKKKIKRTKFLIFIFTILLVILISLKIMYYISSVNQRLNEVALPNTQIEAIDVGGLNRKQLEFMNQERINCLMKKKLTILLGKIKQTYTYQELGVMYEPNHVIDKIFKQQVVNIWSGWFKQLTAEIGFRKVNYRLEPKIDDTKLQQLIANEFTNFQEKPTNASIKISDTSDEITYVDEKLGKKVNITMLKKDIIDAIYKETNNVVVKYINIHPNLSIEDLKKINMKTPMSEYKTDLVGRNGNVRENITRAAKKLNGVIVPSNKEFSFNGIVGVTDQTHGYKNAPVILNNKIIQGAGGGVCQVSSTLYNAVLLANLNIVYRANHSHQVSYVPVGLDATVADNGPDFKFNNNSNTPLYIKTILENDKLIIQLFGKNINDIINVYTETVEQTNSKLKVNTYREVKNKTETSKEFISTSTYKTK